MTGRATIRKLTIPKRIYCPGVITAITKLICHHLQWRHNGCACVSNHQSLDCLLNRFFRRRSKKTLKLHVTGLSEGIHRRPVDSPHKGPVTRKKIFYLMTSTCCQVSATQWDRPHVPINLRNMINITENTCNSVALTWHGGYRDGTSASVRQMTCFIIECSTGYPHVVLCMYSFPIN